MDISSIASLATQMSVAELQQNMDIAMFKKAMDVEAANALALMQALPSMPTVSSTGGIAGEIINVTA